MGADSTLYRASLNYGKSLAGAEFPDTSAQSKAQVNITRTYLKGIGDVFKNLKAEREATEIAQNNQLKEFKKTAKKARAHLLDQEQSQPMKVHDAIFDKFKALEDDFLLVNTTGEDDNAENEKKRASLYAQLQAITNQAVKSRGAIAKYGTMGDDLIITGNIGENIEVSRAIMDVAGNYEHIELFFNEDSQLTYLVQLPGMDKAVEWTIDHFEENTHFHNIETDAYSAQRELFQLNNGKESKDGIWEEKDQKSEKSTFIKTNIGNEDKKFINVAFSEINGRKSWVNSLYDGEGGYDIAFAAAKHLFVEGEQNNIAGLVDVDGVGGITFADMDRTGDEGTPDGKITEADLMQLLPREIEAWQANIKSIIGALTDPGHDGFNLDRSSDALGDYFIDGLGEHFNDGYRDRPPPKTTDLTYAQRLAREKNMASAKKIDDLVRQEDPSILDLKGTMAKEFDIEREGNEYVIYKKYKDDNVPEIRFNVKDKKALSNALYEYSGSDEFYSKGDYGKYEYQEGDTIENPILAKKKTAGPPKYIGEEGKYYENTHTNKIYHFINGEYKELGSEEEDDGRPKVEIK